MTMANLNDYKKFLRNELTPAKNRGFYICPLCGSGAHGGRDSTGALSLTDNGERWRCFSCDPLDGQTGDIFDLFRLRDGLSASDAAAAVLRKYGDGRRSTAAEDFARGSASGSEDPRPAAPLADYREYVSRCHAALSGSRGAEYLEGRGFTPETMRRFRLGYDAAHDAIVIPYPKTANGYHVNRAITDKRYFKPKASEAGREPLFNASALYCGAYVVFVVESQLCAISVEQAGGAAVAIGGSGERKLLEAVKKRRPTAALIVCLDNDRNTDDDPDKHDRTERKARALAEDLRGAGLFALADNSICGESKDPNDALQADPEKFAEAIESVSNRVIAEARRARSLSMSEISGDAAQDQSAQAGTDSAEALRKDQSAQGEAETLKSYEAESAAGFVDSFTEAIDTDTPAIPTGFSGLDKKLEGGLYEGLYVIGAISSLGKTTFALQVIDQIARAGHDCIVFSLEMARYELMAKSVSRLTYQRNGAKLAKTTRGITARARYSKYTDAEKSAIYEALEDYRRGIGPRVWILEGIGNIGVNEIRAQIERHINITGRRPVVMLDYLQILAPATEHGTDKQNTDKAVLELKRMSRDFKIPIIAISSLNRDNYTAPINLAAFKESGAIEYSADVLIGLQYSGMDYQEGETDKARDKRIRSLHKENEANARDGKGVYIDVKILKNRNGGRGLSDAMTFYPMFNIYEEHTGGFIPMPEGEAEEVFKSATRR